MTNDQTVPALRPAERINLAENRLPCDPCGLLLEPDPSCRTCHGKGSVAAPTGRKHISHSSISSFLNCPQRFDYDYMQRLSLLDRPQALALGGAYQYSIEQNDPMAGSRRLERETPIHSQDDADRLLTWQAIVESAAALYLETYEHERGIELEYEMRYRLRNPWTGRYSRTYDFLGYADGLQLTEDGHVLKENKLVSKVGETDIRKLPLDRQLALMRYGVWRVTGIPVSRVHYRYMRKPSIRQRVNESIERYVERIRGDYLERPEFYLQEVQLFCGTDDLLRIEMDLWEWAEQMRAGVKRAHFPRNTSHCADYGGCAFLPLCAGEPDAEHLYQTRPKTTTTTHTTETEKVNV